MFFLFGILFLFVSLPFLVRILFPPSFLIHTRIKRCVNQTKDGTMKVSQQFDNNASGPQKQRPTQPRNCLVSGMRGKKSVTSNGATTRDQCGTCSQDDRSACVHLRFVVGVTDPNGERNSEGVCVKQGSTSQMVPTLWVANVGFSGGDVDSVFLFHCRAFVFAFLQKCSRLSSTPFANGSWLLPLIS